MVFGLGAFSSAAFSAIPALIIQCLAAESTTTTDAVATLASLNPVVAETATGTESVVSNIDALSDVADSSTATDATAATYIQLPEVIETTSLSDSSSALASFASTAEETVTATEQILTSFLWTPIPTLQDPAWTQINTQ